MTQAGEPWTADVLVTVELARELIASQFPQLALDSIEEHGEGWDNVAFLVDGAYIFRFPRRTVAAELIETEIAILPAIARRLPIPISAPSYAGHASDTYPWCFAGYQLLPGTPLARIAGANFELLASELGAFLRALHTIDTKPLVALGLPRDTIGRLDHAQRMPKLESGFDELAAEGFIEDTAPYVNFLNAIAPKGARADRLTLVHGDLYAAHILVDGDRASGIIDWGDVHLGDPAVDISIVFEVFPRWAQAAFRAAYGPIDEQTWNLARYRAIYHAALVAHYGHRIGKADLLQAGLCGLKYSRPNYFG